VSRESTEITKLQNDVAALFRRTEAIEARERVQGDSKPIDVNDRIDIRDYKLWYKRLLDRVAELEAAQGDPRVAPHVQTSEPPELKSKNSPGGLCVAPRDVESSVEGPIPGSSEWQKWIAGSKEAVFNIEPDIKSISSLINSSGDFIGECRSPEYLSYLRNYQEIHSNIELQGAETTQSDCMLHPGPGEAPVVKEPEKEPYRIEVVSGCIYTMERGVKVRIPNEEIATQLNTLTRQNQSLRKTIQDLNDRALEETE